MTLISKVLVGVVWASLGRYLHLGRWEESVVPWWDFPTDLSLVLSRLVVRMSYQWWTISSHKWVPSFSVSHRLIWSSSDCVCRYRLELPLTTTSSCLLLNLLPHLASHDEWPESAYSASPALYQQPALTQSPVLAPQIMLYTGRRLLPLHYLMYVWVLSLCISWTAQYTQPWMISSNWQNKAKPLAQTDPTTSEHLSRMKHYWWLYPEMLPLFDFLPTHATRTHTYTEVRSETSEPEKPCIQLPLHCTLALHLSKSETKRTVLLKSRAITGSSAVLSKLPCTSLKKWGSAVWINSTAVVKTLSTTSFNA